MAPPTNSGEHGSQCPAKIVLVNLVFNIKTKPATKLAFIQLEPNLVKSDTHLKHYGIVSLIFL